MTNAQIKAAAPTTPDALLVPTREQAYAEALRHTASAFRRDEQVWLAGETYDATEIAWLLDVVRRGPNGRWVMQRYRFDAQPETLYFRGERLLSQAELTEVRQTAKHYPM